MEQEAYAAADDAAAAVHVPDAQQSFIPRSWAVWLGIALGAMLIGLLACGRANLIVLGLLAFCNVAICLVFCYRMLRLGAVWAVIPVLVFPRLLLGLPLSTLYFTIFNPAASYEISHGSIPNLDNGVRVQLATLLFMIGFLLLMRLGVGRAAQARTPAVPANARAWATVTLWVYGIALLAAIAANIRDIGGLPLYIINAFPKFGMGLIFLPAFFVRHLTWRSRILMLALILVLGFLYTAVNARGSTMKVIVSAAAGLFMSDISPKSKLRIFLVILVLVPIYLVVGNTTRDLLKSVGYEDFGARIQALRSGWREQLKAGSPLDATFGRGFYTGGHSIIAYTPEQYPYRDWSTTDFVTDLGKSLLLARFVSQPVVPANRALRDYGFFIAEESSVEISMIGYYWLYGGYVMVLIGGFVTGLFFFLLIRLMRRALLKSLALGGYLLGFTLPSIVDGTVNDPITIFRNIAWGLVWGLVLYLLVSRFIPRPQPMPEPVLAG